MTYGCCGHCEHDDALDGPHDGPCPEGCNEADGFGPDAWKNHMEGCVCPDCTAAREEETADA
jgi:hypothetical protein